jgi:transposase
MKKPPSFIPYQQHQLTLLPPSLEELIPEKHIVRVVNRTIDSLDLTKLYERYEGGGRSSFHPAMMLKVVIYAYTQKIYTCRLIAKECREKAEQSRTLSPSTGFGASG